MTILDRFALFNQKITIIFVKFLQLFTRNYNYSYFTLVCYRIEITEEIRVWFALFTIFFEFEALKIILTVLDFQNSGMESTKNHKSFENIKNNWQKRRYSIYFPNFRLEFTNNLKLSIQILRKHALYRTVILNVFQKLCVYITFEKDCLIFLVCVRTIRYLNDTRIVMQSIIIYL
jgi:hypothetical protein